MYPSATGKPVFVTREDFPSEEEFLAFKKWSDENSHSEEKTLEEIAALENVAFQSVHESIESAKKKIFKIFRKTP